MEEVLEPVVEGVLSWEVGKGGVLRAVVSAPEEGLVLHGKGGVRASLLKLEGGSEVLLL